MMGATTIHGARKQRKRAASRGAPARVESGSRSRAAERNAVSLRALQHFRTIFGSARRFDAEVRRAAGISGSLLWALSEISALAGMSVNTLAKRMALHQTTASNIVNTLVGRKLVRRSRDAADHRVVHLELSAEGARLLGQVQGPHAGLLVDALARLEGAEIEHLTECLARVIAEMRGAARTAAGETLLGE
jgi:DNA-binding MarR family transcriptional regulator